MNAHEILKAARAKIERPECWTQGLIQRDKDGHVCDDDEAVCWCGYGAVWSVAPAPVLSDAIYALDHVAEGDFPTWQDAPGRTHAEVLAAFDKAIEATAP